MSNMQIPPSGPKPPMRPASRLPAGALGRLLSLGVAAIGIYGIYFWEVRRVVVAPNEVLVLIKKDGSRSLPGDQVIVPAPPVAETFKDSSAYAAAQDQWEKAYGDCNGIKEEVYPVGTYFRFSPFDYERVIVNIDGHAEGSTLGTPAVVPSGKVGIVVRKFGSALSPGQVLASPDKPERGPLPGVLEPATHYRYANPYAYEIKLVTPVTVSFGERGIVTNMSGKRAANPNTYLVNTGEQGVQQAAEPEGLLYINPFERRVTPISIRSQQFKMIGDDTIRFPSADSFDIQLEGFVEWSVDPKRLPEIYVQYGEGGDLLPLLTERVILPYARSFCRTVGSQYLARDFISGETREKFQAEFRAKLSEACAKQGIEVLQAVVSNIEPPQAIKDPIKDRATAKQQILQYEQQIKVADSQAKLATQTEQATQNQAIGEANKQVVTVLKQAERDRNVAVTRAQQDLSVAQKKLEAAKAQAEAVLAGGTADANVILLKKAAEAEPLRDQVQAFGGGDGYARNFFNQRIAPSVKSILTSNDGPFADLFKQFTSPMPASQQQQPIKTAGGQP